MLTNTKTLPFPLIRSGSIFVDNLLFLFKDCDKLLIVVVTVTVAFL